MTLPHSIKINYAHVSGSHQNPKQYNETALMYNNYSYQLVTRVGTTPAAT